MRDVMAVRTGLKVHGLGVVLGMAFLSGVGVADPESDYQTLVQETRCMVCHNQNIADVDTPFAQHLRLVIREQLDTGASVKEVRHHLRSTYGDAISYRPPEQGLSRALWALPGVLLLVWGLWVCRIVGRR